MPNKTHRNLKFFWFILLFGAILLLLFYGFHASRKTVDCFSNCQQLLFMDLNGRVHVRPSYQSFRLSAYDQQMVINGSLVQLDDMLGGGRPTACKYHAAQMAFFTREQPKKKLYGKYAITGYVLLQMRHDALLGLPGGGVRIGETILQGLRRELIEEMGIENVTDPEYHMSYYNPNLQYCGHLYLKELSLANLRELAKQAFDSPDTGVENFGYLLLPTLNEVDDDPGFDGFPTFLAQAIAPNSPPTLVGNTLQQIMYVLTEATKPPILSKHHMQVGIDQACKLLTLTQCTIPAGQKMTGATLSNFFQ